MSMFIYVASYHSLPLVEWDENNPDFHVTELSENDQIVRKKISKDNVYYVGSF